MIYCISFSDLEQHLKMLGFDEVDRTEMTVLFKRGSEEFTVRAPVQGSESLPEMIANDALDHAGLPVPRWDVFWCD